MPMLEQVAVEFEDKMEAEHNWNRIRDLLGLKNSEAGVDHPAIMASACFHLGLLPKIPKYGSEDGHTWHRDDATPWKTGDEDAAVRSALLKMIDEGAIVNHQGSNDETDSESEEGDATGADGFGEFGESGKMKIKF